MIKREHYLKKIRPFYDSDLIKVITGIRRCGKSVILSQIHDELDEMGKKTVYLDFDILSVRRKYPDAVSLTEYIESLIPKRGLLYVFLDEIQNVDGWNQAVRTLRLEHCSVFISGSNSRLLSGEFTKELSGRYVSFRVRPFVYKEATEYIEQLGRTYSISDYLVWGGFPVALAQPDTESRKMYLNDLNNTIIYNDIENRHSIRRKEIFEKLTDFILCSNSRIFSAQSISRYLKGQNIAISVPTVIKYMDYLKEAYVVNEVSLYSTKTKEKLNYYVKLYDEDVSFNSLRQYDRHYDVTYNLENVVLNELYFMDYEVTMMNDKNHEIDFRATKDGKIYLVQVAYSVVDEKTYEREMSAFAKIDNTNQKILITNDDMDFSTSTVRHISLIDFLKMNDLDSIN